MKIRLAILENDKLYVERLLSYYGKYYADKLEIYAYSEYGKLENAMESTHFDVLLTTQECVPAEAELPEYMGLLYLVEQNDIEKIKDIPAAGKYQKPETVYRQILAVYSSRTDKTFSKKNIKDKECRLFLVTSPSGGVGTSTMAVSMSHFFAGQGKKTLYISLEENGAQDMFFDGVNPQGFSDIIYLLKSRKSNIALRAESIVQRASGGAYYFKQCKNILDMGELNREDVKSLLREICMLGDYDFVIADMGARFTNSYLYVAECADTILTVCDGTEIGLKKLHQFVEAIEILDSQQQKNLMPRLSLVYNKFSSKTGKLYENARIQVLGGIQKFEGANEKEVVKQIVEKQIFAKYL